MADCPRHPGAAADDRRLRGAAFIGIFFLALPFPLIVAAAAIVGYFVARQNPSQLGLATKAEAVAPPAEDRWRQFAIASVVGLVAWCVPIAFAALVLDAKHVLVSIGMFFSKLAVVSFGGAYALLAYMAQEVVQTYGWMTAPEMVDGLGLAETTPGPLILVTQFVGFLAAFRDAAPFSPVTAGVLGAAMTTWVTFVPSMLWIFAGAMLGLYFVACFWTPLDHPTKHLITAAKIAEYALLD
jgi:chromate transporter